MRSLALFKSGNLIAAGLEDLAMRREDAWELRDTRGIVLLLDDLVGTHALSDETCLFLTLKMGAGAAPCGPNP